MKVFIPLFMLIGALHGADLGLNIGPFSLELNVGHRGYSERQGFIDDPICYAISSKQQLRVQFLVEEDLGKGEWKTTLKEVTIDPYVFGYDKNNQPVLRGNITKEEVLKEVTVKDYKPSDDDGKSYSGFFSWFKTTGRSNSINVRGIRSIQVLDNQFFNPPNELDSAYFNDLALVKCKL